ncbi:hypothetical protein NLJ89_g1326 [Agrocybe chaxingu]|uniref:Cytochrome P450 n=1 Tax=Agrocybe chaxingu TaxID=84603 RepID=A0A9W8N067_9AGAR|nr:hypothetical protein NLJ89_g1326 [Agrocybe chaxingu]
MTIPNATLLVAALVGLVLCIFARRKKGPYASLPLPPGPKGLPLIGNLLHLPKESQWEAYHKWCKDLDTDILYLNFAGTDVIVLDSSEAANELLERRSSIYSGRARFLMLNELMGWKFSFGFMEYGEQWRKRRRAMHLEFHPTAAAQFKPHSLRAARNLLNRILDSPEDVMGNLRYAAGETIIAAAYGLNIESKDDPYISLAKEAMHTLEIASIPGAFLVDDIPILKYIPDWFPGAGFKRNAKDWKKLALTMREKPFEAAKKNIAAGAPIPSFVSTSLKRMQEGSKGETLTEDIIRDVAAVLYGAGTDTTLSAMAWCILGLLERPDVLLKAQAEIDRVVKPGHLPDFDDESSLPYIAAIVKEALRWYDVVPTALPHRLEVEDEYKGYRLPAGSLIVPNAWAMLHDETIYPDPFTFNPDRFMKDGKFNPDIRDPEHACWGFGRRICMGRYMALSSIWINIASIIAAFDIKKAVDANGNVIHPTHEYVSALVRLPLPFRCSITPRSKEMEDLIRSSANEDVF